MTDFSKPQREGYSFNGSEIFNQAWALFRRDMGSFIGATVLYLIIAIVVSFLPFISLISSFVQVALFAGYFVYARSLLKGSQTMGDFFKGFNFFLPIFLYQLIIMVILIPLAILAVMVAFPFEELMEVVSSGNTEAMAQTLAIGFMENLGVFALSMTLFAIVAIYVSVSYCMTLPLIVDGNMGFWDAMETSRRTVGKKFFSFFGFFFVFGLVSSVGVIITLGIGALFMYPLWYLSIFYMYENIFQPGGPEEDAIEDFGNASGEINSESQEYDN